MFEVFADTPQRAVGDAFWCVLFMMFCGFCYLLYLFGSWIWYLCHGSQGRARIKVSQLNGWIAETNFELRELNRQVRAKESELKGLRDKVLSYEKMGETNVVR
jgi:hypothetical protein